MTVLFLFCFLQQLLEEIRRTNINLETYYNLHYSQVVERLADLYGIPHDVSNVP